MFAARLLNLGKTAVLSNAGRNFASNIPEVLFKFLSKDLLAKSCSISSLLRNSIIFVCKILRRLHNDVRLDALRKNNNYVYNFIKKLWNLGKLNHVAIAVPDLDKAVSFYQNALRATKVSEKLVNINSL